MTVLTNWPTWTQTKPFWALVSERLTKTHERWETPNSQKLGGKGPYGNYHLELKAPPGGAVRVIR